MSSFLIKGKQAKSFEDKISKLAPKTRSNIYASINSFDKFCKEYYDNRTALDIFAELNTLKGSEQLEALRDVLQNWIDWMYQQGQLTTGVVQYVSKIKRFFAHHGIIIHTTDFDEPLEFKPRIKEELHELTTEEIQNILKYASPKKLSFYLALSCTGARPGELLQIRRKDIDTTGKRIKMRIEAVNVKTRSGRSVWLTKEAGSLLMTRIRNLKPNDLVWAKNENPSYAEKNESTIFSKLCDKAGYTDRYESNGNRKITLYSFRSFFFGRAADVKREGYAHKMTGHGGYLPQYDRMSDEKKLEWFLEVEPELTINSEQRQKLEISKLKKERSEVLKMKDELDEMRQYLKDFATKDRGQTRDIEFYKHTSPHLFEEDSEEDQI